MPQRGAGGITGRSSLDERPGDDAGALDLEFALELVIHKGDVIPDVLEVGHLCNILGIISHRGVGLLSIPVPHTAAPRARPAGGAGGAPGARWPRSLLPTAATTTSASSPSPADM